VPYVTYRSTLPCLYVVITCFTCCTMHCRKFLLMNSLPNLICMNHGNMCIFLHHIAFHKLISIGDLSNSPSSKFSVLNSSLDNPSFINAVSKDFVYKYLLEYFTLIRSLILYVLILAMHRLIWDISYINYFLNY